MQCLIEIKCPLRRTITEEVPHHYFPQIQVQLEVCQLEVCWFVQWKPASLNRGTEQLCITKVCRDREWFARHRETLYSFYVDFQEMMRTRQPAPQPEPLPCPIDLTLYGEVQ